MPFSKTTHVKHTYGWSNGTIILKVSHQGRIGYTFFESSLCNLKFWQGDTSFAEYEIMFPLFEVSAIEDSENDNSHYLTPNPIENTSILYFHLNSLTDCKIKIYDAFCKIIDEFNYIPVAIGKQQLLLNFEKYSSGNYFYSIQNGSNNLFGKFIVLK